MLLQIRNLRCGYGSLEIVKGVSLHVCPGEIVTLVGANGAGKTSLLRSIIGLLPPWSGEVFVSGKSVAGQAPWRSVSHAMVLVPEGHQIFSDMTVWENLLVGGYHNPDRRLTIDEILELFPRLKERSQQMAGTLSGGEQQMLAMGRALVAKPRFILLDEPSMGLAPLMVREVFAIIQRLRDHGVTVFLVEQNAMAALRIADRAYVMEVGEIILEGLAADLLSNPEVRRAYLGKGVKESWE
jgi:branched-chain amino acid transport system ATP-binding protein